VFQVRCDKSAVRSGEQDVCLECGSVLDVTERWCGRQHSRDCNSVDEWVRRNVRLWEELHSRTEYFCPICAEMENFRELRTQLFVLLTSVQLQGSRSLRTDILERWGKDSTKSTKFFIGGFVLLKSKFPEGSWRVSLCGSTSLRNAGILTLRAAVPSLFFFFTCPPLEQPISVNCTLHISKMFVINIVAVFLVLHCWRNYVFPPLFNFFFGAPKCPALYPCGYAYPSLEITALEWWKKGGMCSV